MFRILTLFIRRYVEAHFRIERPGFSLVDQSGHQVGYVDRVTHHYDRMLVSGWSVAPGVALGCGLITRWQSPDLQREDVSFALNLDALATPGFELECAENKGMATLALNLFGSIKTYEIANIGKLRFHAEFARLLAAFCWQFLISARLIFEFAISPNLKRKQALKLRFGIGQHSKAQTFDSTVFHFPANQRADGKISIVVPVFNAFDQLCECLERVAKNTDMPWRLIIIDDASTDTRVRPWLRKWKAEQSRLGHQVELVENVENLGFIGSVNNGLKIALTFDDNVILLNTDAFVPARWATRLCYPLMQNVQIASVTPMSNNAEILTAPEICHPLVLRPGEADRHDEILSKTVSPSAYYSIPTGVGFCMALSNRFLRKIPEFDQIFGRGYGEEVDWCQKTRKLGAKHVVQAGLFVQHVGGSSFGSKAKQQLLIDNGKRISDRYPEYDKDVQAFIQSDPVLSARVVHAISLAALRQETLPVYIAHNMGGGAEAYLRDAIADHTMRQETTVVLRVGTDQVWKIEIHKDGVQKEVSTSDSASVLGILRHIPNLKIVYSCGVGHPKPLDIPDFIEAVLSLGQARLKFLVHDYFCVNPNYTLIDVGGKPVDIHPTNEDERHWQEKWGQVISRADEIICFSKSSATLVQTVYPQVKNSISIVPHKIPAIEKMSKPRPHGNIGVLGDIGPHKGAALVSELSFLDGADAMRVVIVGKVAPQYPLGRRGSQTGPYKRGEISKIGEANSIACWLIPSIWPETFSYTTHEALATGLPVFVFDLGAQSEASKASKNGHVMPFEWAQDPQRVHTYILGVLTDGKTHSGIHKET